MHTVIPNIPIHVYVHPKGSQEFIKSKIETNSNEYLQGMNLRGITHAFLNSRRRREKRTFEIPVGTPRAIPAAETPVTKPAVEIPVATPIGRPARASDG